MRLRTAAISGLILTGLSFAMGAAVDRGLTHGWSATARGAWVVAILAFMLGGVGLVGLSGYRALMRSVIDPDTETFTKALTEAQRLRKTDPKAADRIEKEAASRWDSAMRRQYAELQARAATDSRAAAELRQRALDGLRGIDLARKQLRRQADAVPDSAQAVQALDAQERAFRRDLAEADDRIARLEAQDL